MAGYNIIDLKALNASDQEQLQTEKASAVRSSLGNKPPEMSCMETLASYGKLSEAFFLENKPPSERWSTCSSTFLQISAQNHEEQ